MRNLTAYRSTHSGVSTGSFRHFEIQPKYLYAGHEYRVAVRAVQTNGSSVWMERTFKVLLGNERQQIIQRGDAMTNFTWKPHSGYTVRGWRNQVTYTSSQTYSGVPYSQTAYQRTISAVPWEHGSTSYQSSQNNYSTTGFYQNYTRFGIVMPRYGNDCSGYTSILWNVPRQTTETFRDGISAFPRVGRSSESAIQKYGRLSPGDALNAHVSGGTQHVFVVKSISPVVVNNVVESYNIVVLEQTPYNSHQETYNSSGLISVYQPITRANIAQDYSWNWAN